MSRTININECVKAMEDKDIILAMKDHPDKGFRLLMAKYGEPVY